MRLAAPFVPFDPPVDAHEAPASMPSPFASGQPHPWATRAADELMAALRDGWPLPPAAFREPARGKMFGVLVVATPDGRIGYLKSFSGMLADSWEVPGFCPPVFDLRAREGFWPPGEAALRAFDVVIEDARLVLAATEQTRAAQEREHERERAELEELHRQRKEARRTARAVPPSPEVTPSIGALAWEALANESREDARQLRLLRARQAEARRLVEATIARAREDVEGARRAQLALSDELLEKIFAGYVLESAHGQARTLRERFFAPGMPPGGAGDCAAPKLLVAALRRGLRPLALAEFWWGDPPANGGRLHGVLYPACRGKCGPVLAHLCDGLRVEPPPVYGADPLADALPRVLFEDECLLVVEKPAGMLSVPGRAGTLKDCVQARLRRRFPQHPALTLVHRLDLDTSGLLLVSKDEPTYIALQSQFAERAIEKRYVAWLEGRISAETEGSGYVDLPLRVDLDDRPRQIHDPVHGKSARTRWRLDRCTNDRSRVWLFPETGRTHQLRVHAAHPRGLGAPIVGDRLYGKQDERLFLHAEALTFTHPRSGERLTFESPAPF